MYTRIVELTTKPGKVPDLLRMYNDTIVGMVTRQKGCVDLVALIPEDKPNKLISVSFWNSKEDAERYAKESYNKILDSIRNLIEGDPVIQKCNVEYSTTQHIAHGKAA
jgi:quinol monooxygenase YgiN